MTTITDAGWPAIRARDGGAFAAWLLDRLNRDPDRPGTKAFVVPDELTPDETTEVQAGLVRAAARTERQHPDIAFNLLDHAAGVIVALHEHDWQDDGSCTRCATTREGPMPA